MKGVFIVSDNIISPLGLNTTENFTQLKQGNTGIRLHNRPQIAEHSFYASLIEPGTSSQLFSEKELTAFEQLLIASVTDALENTPVDISSDRTIIIISTTKGNISLLAKTELDPSIQKRVSLHHSANLVAQHFNSPNKPLVISSACISGSLALLTAMRLLRSGTYANAVVCGADIISKFILSGFQSFQALSPGICTPFDAGRNGINLGEGAATIVLSTNPDFSNGIQLAGGSTSNDANHISGPSRTGEELCQAINDAMSDAELTAGDIQYISAHGTATIYNDEMEANAITLAGLQDVPVNSLKAYYGHTLGAAGLIESVVSIQCMQENLVIPSKGFINMGVSKPLNIATELVTRPIQHCLKTASGFGGCNAALIFKKEQFN